MVRFQQMVSISVLLYYRRLRLSMVSPEACSGIIVATISKIVKRQGILIDKYALAPLQSPEYVAVPLLRVGSHPETVEV